MLIREKELIYLKMFIFLDTRIALDQVVKFDIFEH